MARGPHPWTTLQAEEPISRIALRAEPATLGPARIGSMLPCNSTDPANSSPIRRPRSPSRRHPRCAGAPVPNEANGKLGGIERDRHEVPPASFVLTKRTHWQCGWFLPTHRHLTVTHAGVVPLVFWRLRETLRASGGHSNPGYITHPAMIQENRDHGLGRNEPNGRLGRYSRRTVVPPPGRNEPNGKLGGYSRRTVVPPPGRNEPNGRPGRLARRSVVPPPGRNEPNGRPGRLARLVPGSSPRGGRSATILREGPLGSASSIPGGRIGLHP